MTTDELRAKFESAISSFDPNEFKAIFSLERGEDGGYKDEAILALWNGYRLGYASRDAEVEALKDALFQISVRLNETREPDMDDMSWHTDMMARAQYLVNVENEVEALRKDAERYRAFRRAAIREDDSFIERVMLRIPDKDCTESQFDEAIDAAMQEGE